MSATREVVREQIEALDREIVAAKGSNDGARVASLEEQKRSLLRQLTELNEHKGQVLTDSPVATNNVLKG